MKKLFILVMALFTSVVLIGCDNSNTVALDKMMTSQESLVSLSYLSAGFLDMDNQDETLLSFTRLSDTDEPVIEEELDEINIYIDLLKGFIDNGSENFGSILEEASDRAEFARMISINVQDEEYILYYNVDMITGEITGIFLIGNVEYEIIATNSLEDSDQFESEDEYEDEEENEYEDDEYDDDDDYDDVETTSEEQEITTEEAVSTEGETTTEDEATTEEIDPDSEAGASQVAYRVSLSNDADEDENDEVSDESEYKMELLAQNGDNFIKITYKTETDGSESVTKFEIEKNINGVEEEIEIKVKQEADEYKVEIQDGSNSYEFKSEVESEGTFYKLEYKVNGVEGEVKIYETEDAEGNLTYSYDISEGNVEKSIDKDEPDSSFDNDEHEEEDEEIEIDGLSFHQ
jgi:hypothetical protein